MDGGSCPGLLNYVLLEKPHIPLQGVEAFMELLCTHHRSRAGHGPLYWRSEPDSQVGVALHDGHPVYFVAFRPHPEPDQTSAHVMRVERNSRQIGLADPKAAKPIIVGNCQGGGHHGARRLILDHRSAGDRMARPWPYPRRRIGRIRCATTAACLGASCRRSCYLNRRRPVRMPLSRRRIEMLNPGRNDSGSNHDLFASSVGGRWKFLESPSAGGAAFIS